MRTMKKTRSLVVLFILASLAIVLSNAPAATIYYVGTLTNSMETINWLTPTTAKTYDIDGDNIYGSYCAVQYRVVGTFVSTGISFVSSGTQYRQPEYTLINDLMDATQGNVGPGAVVNNSPTNSNSSLCNAGQVTFQVNQDLTGSVLRVGVMEDILGAAEYPRDTHKGVHIVQTTGGSTWSAVVPLPNSNHQPEMVFFDIVNAKAGDRYLIEEMRQIGNVDSITWVVGPVSWDLNTVAAVSTAPTIVQTTGAGQYGTGSDVLLGVLAGGAPTPTYQWYKGASPIASATNAVLWLSNAAATDTASYKVVATTPAGSVTSGLLDLSVIASNAPASIKGYRTAVNSEPSLMSLYTFDNGAKDLVGTNHGVIGGTPGVGYSLTPGVGQGLDTAVLLCADGRVNLGTVPKFSFPNKVGTFETWLRADWTNTPGYNPCIAANRDSTGTRWSIHMNAAKDAVGVYNGSTYNTLPLIPPAGFAYNAGAVLPQAGAINGVWHHLAIIFNNGQWILVWDGLTMGTNTLQALGAGTTTQVQIGASAPSSWQENWVGAIDEAAFYSDALDPQRVAAHYNAFLTNNPPVIRQQPVGAVALAVAPFQLNLIAQGVSLNYQWYQNNLPLKGATANPLVFSSLVQSNGGAYFCVVTNTSGSITSSTVNLQVAASQPAAVQAYAKAVMAEPSLVSYYRFDDGSANDSKGTHHGVLNGIPRSAAGFFGPGYNGGPDQAYVSGGTGSAGSSGWISFGTVNEFVIGPGGAGTVEMWLRADWSASPGYNPTLFAVRTTPNNTTAVDYSIHMNANKAQIMVWNGSTVPALAIPNAGTSWHHLAVIFISGTWTAVWDGNVIGTNAQQLQGAVSPVQIGSSTPAGTEWWIGALDEVAIYNDALDPAAVQAHYAAYLSRVPPAFTTQPVGGTFLLGSEVDLTPVVTGPNTYSQWYKNNTALTGATNQQLAILNVKAADAGNYFVVITNTGGSVTSAVASIALVAPQTAKYRAAVRAEPGLISYYNFDNQNANDLVSANHGIMAGVAQFTGGLGGGGDRAFLMDGASDWIVFDAPEFDFRNSSGSGTIEAWVRADWTSDPGYNPYLLADSDGMNNNYIVQMNQNKSVMAGFAIPPAGTNWHHMAVVFYFGNRTLYWDGVARGTAWQPLYSQTPAVLLQVGSWSTTGLQMWIGAIDDLAIYNIGLSATTVQNHYQTMLFGTVAVTPVSLSVSLANGNVTLSWPANATGWTLESSSQLPAASWSAVAGVVNNQITLPPSGSAKFFRLRNGP